MRYACVVCDAGARRLVRVCSQCGGENTLVEMEAVGRGGPVRADAEDGDAEGEAARVLTGMVDFDAVLGGGWPEASVLLTGDPGAGKSSLSYAAASKVAAVLGGRALVVSAEMPVSLARAAAKRAGADLAHLDLWSESDVVAIGTELRRKKRPAVVVDSAQALTRDGAELPTHLVPVEVRKLLAVSSPRTLVIGQVSRSGEAEGSRRLEHALDVVVRLSAVAWTATKNRFGPAKIVERKVG